MKLKQSHFQMIVRGTVGVLAGAAALVLANVSPLAFIVASGAAGYLVGPRLFGAQLMSLENYLVNSLPIEIENTGGESLDELAQQAPTLAGDDEDKRPRAKGKGKTRGVK